MAKCEALIAQDGAEQGERFVLTPRELEVGRLLMTGASNKEIAGDLVVEVRTIKAHVSRIMAKLGVGNRTQAAFALMEQLGRA